MNRRNVLKLGGGACASTLLARGSSRAASPPADPDRDEFVGVLMDIQRCTGCRKCEEACAEANGLPVPDIRDKSVFESPRKKAPTRFTIVNRYDTEAGPLYVKTQCMHCNQPACTAACLVRALEKTRTGPVPWNGSKCMGCRYCMVSCPFDAPKFEYDSANPRIRKCTLCHTRLEEGKLPACVEGCPVEALTFGPRRQLVEIARSRIYHNPDRYVHEIYGEHDVGGTSWLYLSPVPFDQLGFRTDLGTRPVPELTQDFLYAVPFVLVLWPVFLYGVSQIERRQAVREEAAEPGGRDSA